MSEITDGMIYIGNETYCESCMMIVRDWTCRCYETVPFFPLPDHWLEVGLFVVGEERELRAIPRGYLYQGPGRKGGESDAG